MLALLSLLVQSIYCTGVQWLIFPAADEISSTLLSCELKFRCRHGTHMKVINPVICTKRACTLSLYNWHFWPASCTVSTLLPRGGTANQVSCILPRLILNKNIEMAEKDRRVPYIEPYFHVQERRKRLIECFAGTAQVRSCTFHAAGPYFVCAR